MRKRGQGPKHVLVRKHARWMDGERLRVRQHKKGADPKIHAKATDRQLHFGFY